MTKQFLLVSYDISDNRRRTCAMKTLEDFGRRVQYSVFECRLLPTEIGKLKKRLRPLALESQDSIRIYFIGAEDIGRILVLGSGKVTEDSLYYIQ